MTDQNGRIKLSLPQIVTVLTILAALFAAWYDLRASQSVTNIRVETANENIRTINRKIDRLEDSVAELRGH